MELVHERIAILIFTTRLLSGKRFDIRYEIVYLYIFVAFFYLITRYFHHTEEKNDFIIYKILMDKMYILKIKMH